MSTESYCPGGSCFDDSELVTSVTYNPDTETDVKAREQAFNMCMQQGEYFALYKCN